MNIASKTLLITGIDNFIGLRAAELALERGLKVRGLQTSGKREKNTTNLDADLLIGNITDVNIAQKACQGVDIVFHAEQLSEESGDINKFREINVVGTLNMAKAAKDAGVKIFVHLSSVLVYGFNYPNQVTESGLLSGENNPYCQTKIEAESALLKLNSPPDFNIIIIRAGDVYGPGSIPWVVRPLLLMRQNFFAYANDGKGVSNHLYIDNLIEALFLAVEKEPSGEIFNITDGQETSWKEYFAHLAAIEGLATFMSLPKDELKLLLQVRRQGQKLLRKKADILPESLDFITRPYAYSITKAKTILGYQPKIDLKEGMLRTHEWLKKTDIQELI
ncbi:NAD(P)-dependent oxidoreductase [Anabaena sphaerica FACHB-251]|uniref:NAD(P)-dependent oxidoreductase n=1 Tax=Anabaena sphaerica FACHB-251 TaxID=2692883 RepID=A0A926WFZ1_9NOST|nr:NAD(P)-dependent oxidoreductase [Anabaena sphaerica]MBD2293395.1 NAD(P)-dependent oxidoreductase [Anabaena sphaerica FACHB-251]